MGSGAVDELKIEQRHINAARRAGACSEGLGYKPGTSVSSVEQADLIWVQDNVPALASEARAATGLDLWALSDSGDADGSGDGSGYGSGDGSGNGDGDGYGYGYGDGAGYGDGSGYGDGYGYGYGDGSGYGDGYGTRCGDGHGD